MSWAYLTSPPELLPPALLPGRGLKEPLGTAKLRLQSSHFLYLRLLDYYKATLPQGGSGCQGGTLLGQERERAGFAFINFWGKVNEIMGQTLTSSQGRGQERPQVVEVAVGHDQHQIIEQHFQQSLRVDRFLENEGRSGPAPQVLKFRALMPARWQPRSGAPPISWRFERPWRCPAAPRWRRQTPGCR